MAQFIVVGQFQRPATEHIKDPQVRHVIDELCKQVEALYDMNRALVDTDPGRGTVRLRAPIIARRLPANPLTTSQFGVEDELRSYNGKLYQKQSGGEDTNWREI